MSRRVRLGAAVREGRRRRIGGRTGTADRGLFPVRAGPGGGKQVQEVVLGVPRNGDRRADHPGQVGQLVEESVDALAAHPGVGFVDLSGKQGLLGQVEGRTAQLRHGRRGGRSHGHRDTRVRRRLGRPPGRRPGRTGDARRPAAPPGPRPPHTHAQLLSTVPATGGAVVSLYRPGTEASGATLRASAILLAALVRAVILIEALDHAEAAMHTAEVAADLNRPLLAPPATEDLRAEGSARLRAEQRAVLVLDPARALALL